MSVTVITVTVMTVTVMTATVETVTVVTVTIVTVTVMTVLVMTVSPNPDMLGAIVSSSSEETQKTSVMPLYRSTR